MLPDPLAGKYKLKCAFAGCHGTLTISHTYGVGLKKGDAIPRDASNSAFGRCPICRRHTMVVVEAPEAAPTPALKGFTKVPAR